MRRNKEHGKSNFLIPVLLAVAALGYFAVFSGEEQPVKSNTPTPAQAPQAPIAAPGPVETISELPQRGEKKVFSADNLPDDLPQDIKDAMRNPNPKLPTEMKEQASAPPPELPEDLRKQLEGPPPELPEDLKAQLNAPPPPIPEDIKRSLQTPPRRVSIDEVNNPQGGR